MQDVVFRRISELCDKMQVERDPQKVATIMEELNRLLDETSTFKSPPPKSAAISAA